MKRNQGAAFLFAVLLFGSGVFAGVLGQRYFGASVVSARTAEDFRQHYMAEMKSRLKLSAGQVSRLDLILDETKAKYKTVRDQCRPEMVKIKDEQIDRVKSILTPAQVPAYEQLVAERERRFKEQEERERRSDLAREAADRARVGK